jgi:putative transposase
VRRTYRYRLYPTRNQAQALEEQLGEACELYNAALQHRRDMWRDHRVSMSVFEQQREIKDLRVAGLLDPRVNAWSQGAVLVRLDRAFQAFFRRLKAGERPGYPRFRSACRFDTLAWSFRHGGIGLTDAGRLRLQGVGHVKIKMHRPIPLGARLRQGSVTRHADRWYVSLALDDVGSRPLPATGRSIGIDLGISTFAATSDGEMLPGPRANRAAAQAVRRAQRTVARRRGGSNRRRKAAALLARQREREANRRSDHAHKVSRDLVRRYDTICIEDLRVRGLARGILARDVHDQGWGLFTQLLASKAEDAGRELILVDPKNTSQACSACGEIVPKSLAVRVHSCACGYTADRDVNAARNILTRGLGPDGAVRRQRWRAESRAVA